MANTPCLVSKLSYCLTSYLNRMAIYVSFNLNLKARLCFDGVAEQRGIFSQWIYTSCHTKLVNLQIYQQINIG